MLLYVCFVCLFCRNSVFVPYSKKTPISSAFFSLGCKMDKMDKQMDKMGNFYIPPFSYICIANVSVLLFFYNL